MRVLKILSFELCFDPNLKDFQNAISALSRNAKKIQIWNLDFRFQFSKQKSFQKMSTSRILREIIVFFIY